MLGSLGVCSGAGAPAWPGPRPPDSSQEDVFRDPLSKWHLAAGLEASQGQTRPTSAGAAFPPDASPPALRWPFGPLSLGSQGRPRGLSGWVRPSSGPGRPPPPSESALVIRGLGRGSQDLRGHICSRTQAREGPACQLGRSRQPGAQEGGPCPSPSEASHPSPAPSPAPSAPAPASNHTHTPHSWSP